MVVVAKLNNYSIQDSNCNRLSSLKWLKLLTNNVCHTDHMSSSCVEGNASFYALCIVLN